jgi:hypothetical protein
MTELQSTYPHPLVGDHALAFDNIVEYFNGNVPELSNILSFNELIRRYQSNTVPGYFYDPDTKKWFGTRNPHLIAPGVTVECQTKAPEGVDKYAITVWTIDEVGDLRPSTLARRPTLGTANRYGRAVHEAWKHIDR